MASDESTYNERLHLADSFEEYQEYLSPAHYHFLVQKSLEETWGGAAKIRYILALASRCRRGLVSVQLLAKKIDKEYSLCPSLDEQQGGVKGGQEEGWQDVDTDMDETDDQNDEQQDKEGGGEEGWQDVDTDMDEVDDQNDEGQDKEEEGEAPHVTDEVEKLIDTIGSEVSWLRVTAACKPFVVPDQGRVLHAHDIETLRPSTHKDFDSATPKSMPAYTNGNTQDRGANRRVFMAQVRSYHLCKKVAVSFDGNIYRATDAEIELALKNDPKSPSMQPRM